MRAAAMVLALLLAAGGPAAASTPTEAYRQAAAGLIRHDDGFGMLDAATGASGALRAYQTAVQAWAADWFDQHPGTQVAAVSEAAKWLDHGLDLAAVRLDAHSVLVSANHGQLGTVFILSDRSGPNAVAWDITESSAAPSLAHGTELAAWAPARSTGDCRNTAPDGSKAICGPLYGRVGALPRDGKGRSRFYVEGTYGQEAGATLGKQLSLWTWDGAEAKPVLVHLYAVMADQDGPRTRGGVLRIPAKGAFRTLFTCGACVGREMQIVIRLDTPNGALSADERSLTPELDLIDELYDRVLRRQPISTIASPKVARRVADKTRAAKPDDVPLGMIESWTLSRTTSGRVLCLNSDSDHGAHLFTFAREAGRLKIVDIRPATSDCTGPGARN